MIGQLDLTVPYSIPSIVRIWIVFDLESATNRKPLPSVHVPTGSRSGYCSDPLYCPIRAPVLLRKVTVFFLQSQIIIVSLIDKSMERTRTWGGKGNCARRIPPVLMTSMPEVPNGDETPHTRQPFFGRKQCKRILSW